MGSGQGARRGQGVSKSHTSATRARGVGGPQPDCLAGSAVGAGTRRSAPGPHFLLNEKKTGCRPHKSWAGGFNARVRILCILCMYMNRYVFMLYAYPGKTGFGMCQAQGKCPPLLLLWVVVL